MTIQECERQIEIFSAKKKALQILQQLKKNKDLLAHAGFDTFELQLFITSLELEIDEQVV